MLVSLGLSRNAEIMVVAGAAFAVVLLAVVIWQTWPPQEDLGQPATLSTLSVPAPGAAPAVTTPTVPDGAPAAAEGLPPVSTDPALEATRADFEEKLVGRPKDAALWKRLGQVLEQMGRGEEAITAYERAVAIEPLEPAHRLGVARLSAVVGKWDRAVDQYREAMRLRPKDVDILNALAVTLQKKGDDQAAVVEFQRARRLEPSSAPIALGLATSLEKTGRGDDAIVEFRHYLELNPDPAAAERVKAHLALLTRGRPQVK